MGSHRRVEARSCHPEEAQRPKEPESSFGPLAKLALSAAEGLRVTIALSAALAVIASSAAAQVGHPPRSSPYHDIRKGHTFTVLGGYFGGDGGSLDIGPHGGAVYGVRYDIRTGGTIQLGLGIAHGSLDRFLVDPFVPEATRKTGPVKQSVNFADITVQFNLTGGKSWHRLAPFVSGSAGLAMAGDTPADTSGFDFGRKFYIAPAVGARVFLSDRLHLRAEARATFWKLNYPVTFQREPTAEVPTPVIAPGGKLSEWTTSSWLQVGLGYSFSP